MAEEIAENRDRGTVHAVGLQLRAAREESGMALEEVAAETRIPQRHLVAIEEGDFAALPARTYAIGFSKTFAKVVGLDPDVIAGEVRAELDAQQPVRSHRPAPFEPGDPARVPSARLGWIAAIAALLLLVGGFFFFRAMFAPAAELPSLIEQQKQEEEAEARAEPQAESVPAAVPQPTAAPGGPVVFTALEDVWIRVRDANGTLFEKEMQKGESYTVPQDAQEPVLRTGRPDALVVTVGGRELPPLAQEQRVMSDVPITAEALLARGQPRPAT